MIFINQDSGYLMIDLINSFTEAGHTCILITGRLNRRNNHLNSNVKIERIIYYDRTSQIKRLYTWTIGFIQIWLKVFLKFRQDELFIVSNPPFALLLPLFVKNRYNILVYDVYPDILIELGYISERSFIVKWWGKANKKIFPRSEVVFTITESMKQLLKKYSRDKQINVIPIWTDNQFLKPIARSKNPFLTRHNIVNKFVVLYSGNIGLAGNVDLLIDVASEVKSKNIVFLIIGDGAKKRKIFEESIKRKLSNLILLPWQPTSELPYSLSAASVAVVTLGIKASKLAVPSKLYNYLSVGAPLLGICAEGSEVDRIISKYNCGKSFNPGNLAEMVSFIIELANNEKAYQEYRNNALKASKHYDVTNVKQFLSFYNNE
jgi:glycosyltransferase involved in cell wall biosynthesis